MNILTAPVMYGLAGLALIAALGAGVQTLRLSKCQTRVVAADARADAQAAQVAICAVTLSNIKTSTAQAKADAIAQAKRADEAVKREAANHVEYLRTVADIQGELADARRDPACAQQLEAISCAKIH